MASTYDIVRILFAVPLNFCVHIAERLSESWIRKRAKKERPIWMVDYATREAKTNRHISFPLQSLVDYRMILVLSSLPSTDKLDVAMNGELVETKDNSITIQSKVTGERYRRLKKMPEEKCFVIYARLDGGDQSLKLMEYMKTFASAANGPATESIKWYNEAELGLDSRFYDVWLAGQNDLRRVSFYNGLSDEDFVGPDINYDRLKKTWWKVEAEEKFKGLEEDVEGPDFTDMYQPVMGKARS